MELKTGIHQDIHIKWGRNDTMPHQITEKWLRCTGDAFHDLADAYLVRQQVFVDEQGFTEEFDETDKTAHHVVIYLDGSPAATGRLFSTPDGWVIGRVAVRKDSRGLGLGLRIMRDLEERARQLGAGDIRLMAQERARKFYERAGYRQTGSRCLEEGCPHVWMRKELTAGAEN